MDTAHITVAKIVATPLDTSWAQAYSAGKLYIALSLQGDGVTLAALGKDTIEKLQREFFALDEKSLTAVKKAVETVTSAAPSETAMSLVLCTIVESVLYIIIVNSGSVLIKRAGKLSVIAMGEKDAISSFSGRCEPDDIFILTTDGFLKTVSMKDIESATHSSTSNEIAENLAPFIHENATGTEASLIIKIGTGAKPEIMALPEKEEETAGEPNDHMGLEEAPTHKSALSMPHLPTVSFQLKKYIPRKLTKMHLIIGGVIILVLILGGSILFENMKRQSSAQTVRLEQLLAPNKSKYEEAMAVMSLNKSLATEELTQIKTDLEKEQSSFPKGSDARKQLDAFLKTVTDALGGETSSNNSPISVFLDAGKSSDLSSVLKVTTKGGELIAAGSSDIGIVDSEGKITDSFAGGGAPKGMSATEDAVYVLSGSDVSKFAKSDGKEETVIEGQDKPISIATFGDNVYLLSSTDKTVYKYRPNAYAKEEYFTKETTLKNPSSIAIDSSIYVIDDGKVRKFTRGAEDTFNYQGGSLSKGSQIYTDEDYANLYIIDPVSKTFLVIDKSGGLVSNISLKGMKTISSVTANEADKKAYVVGDNKIYSISF